MTDAVETIVSYVDTRVERCTCMYTCAIADFSFCYKVFVKINT